MKRDIAEVDLTRRLLRRLGGFEMKRAKDSQTWSVCKQQCHVFWLSLEKPLTGKADYDAHGLLPMLNIIEMICDLDRPSWLSNDIGLTELDFRLSVEGF